MSQGIKLKNADILHQVQLSWQIPQIIAGIVTHKIITTALAEPELKVATEEFQKAANRMPLMNQLGIPNPTRTKLEKHNWFLDNFEEIVDHNWSRIKLAHQYIQELEFPHHWGYREFVECQESQPEMAKLIINPDSQLVTVEDPSPTISVLWDQVVQEAVINTAPGPTIASRAYSMVHTAIFDAWAAYDLTAISTQLGDDLQRPEWEVTETNKREAISYAAYRVLEDLFPSQIDIFDSLMAELGYEPENNTTDTTTPAGIGNVSAQTLLDFRHHDGSNQLGNHPNGNGNPYSDITNYQPVNSIDQTLNIELWTPEFVPIEDPNGSVQQFLTPQWGKVIPFAWDSGVESRPVAPEPFLLVEGNVDLAAQTITLEDGSVLDIELSLVGSVINPEFINQATKVIEFSANHTDEQK